MVISFNYFSSGSQLGGTNGNTQCVPTIGGNPLYARISLTSANKLFSTWTHLFKAHAPPIVQITCIHGSNPRSAIVKQFWSGEYFQKEEKKTFTVSFGIDNERVGGEVDVAEQSIDVGRNN
jgi:hypothetical protein